MPLILVTLHQRINCRGTKNYLTMADSSSESPTVLLLCYKTLPQLKLSRRVIRDDSALTMRRNFLFSSKQFVFLVYISDKQVQRTENCNVQG